MNHSSPSSERTLLSLAREKKGWTQAYVAAQVGASVSTVRQWEKGRLPYPTSIQKLCALFSMSPQELGLFNDSRQSFASETGQPDADEKQTAWEIYIELVTRIPLADPDGERGLLREALLSLYTLFQTTRTLLRHLGPKLPAEEGIDRSCAYLAVKMLNQVLRPLLSKWHPLLQDYEKQRPDKTGIIEYEKYWEKYEEIHQEMTVLRQTLRGYAEAFAHIAGIPSLFIDQL